jgi:hypothetical protein
VRFGFAFCLLLSFALADRAATSSDFDSLSGRVSAMERRVTEVERRVDALIRAPEPARERAPSDAPVPLYLGGGGELPRLDERNRLNARHALLVELERAGVTEVGYDDGSQTHRFAPPWQKAGFVVAPVEILLAMRAAATAPFAGVELDLRVATAERGIHYVTLIHELDGRLLVTDVAAPNVAPRSPPSSDAALRKRFGIGRLDAGEAPWSPRERESLERALSLLSKDELARVRGLELRRFQRPTRILPVKGACGLSVVEWDARWLEIYDCAFRDDDIVFVGDPRAPERQSTRLILHELGHALGSHPVFELQRALQGLADDGKAIGDEYLALRARAVAADQRTLDEIVAPVPKLSARLHAIAKRVADARPAGPAVTAFSRLPGAANGITGYGRQAPVEAFAEAFSLFRADPAALRRVSPAALAFFEQSGHLRGAQ